MDNSIKTTKRLLIIQVEEISHCNMIIPKGSKRKKCDNVLTYIYILYNLYK